MEQSRSVSNSHQLDSNQSELFALLHPSIPSLYTSAVTRALTNLLPFSSSDHLESDLSAIESGIKTVIIIPPSWVSCSPSFIHL